MASDDLPGQPGTPQRRALSGDERALLYRVIGMLEGDPHFAGTMRPRLRAAIGDGTRPQERDLTAEERRGLRDMIDLVVRQWAEPRLPWEAQSGTGILTGADIARLGLIFRAIAPPPEDEGRPLAVNAADWAPPEPVPDGWVIATAPRPVRGPAGARAWRGERPHGEFYAAWPADDDHYGFWEDSGAREVVVLSNQEIAGEAGRYLAAHGLLPGDAGLAIPGIARDLGLPWKDGIMDDVQARDAALAAIVSTAPREDENTGYDFSDGPQRRELTSGERAFLHQLIGLAAADPRFASGEIIWRPVIRAVLGDGTRPQARSLTARERDDIGWLARTIRSEWRYAREQPGAEHLSPWATGLPGSDVARLSLIGYATTPRHGTPYLDGDVLVNAADWAPPEPVPDGWAIGNAPVPLSGPLTWQGSHTGHGTFYAAAPDDDDDPYGGWLAECANARLVKIVTDEDAVTAACAFLAGYGCARPEDAGMTIAEVARDLGYPLPPGRAEAAVTAAAGATWGLRTTRGDGEVAWYAVHGTRARDHVAAAAAQDGWQVTSGEIPLSEASAGARDMIALALEHGWDVAYTCRAGGEQVTARNPNAGPGISQSWDARGRLASRPAQVERITASPRPLYMPAGPAAFGPSGPAARGLPEGTAGARQKGGRSARARNGGGGTRRGGGSRRGPAG